MFHSQSQGRVESDSASLGLVDEPFGRIVEVLGGHVALMEAKVSRAGGGQWIDTEHSPILSVTMERHVWNG